MEIKECKTEEQLQELAALASHIWHEYFTSIITLEQIDYMVEKYQSYDAIKQAIQEEHYTYFVAYEEGVMVAYCGVKPEEERLFLSKLYVCKEKRGKHYSTLLLQRAIALAKDLHKTAIYLTCNKYNQHSLDVYKGKGFVTIDAVQTDISHGFIMDDYILQLDI
ncbi:MAG: GNAT family N-acetyltransferase [Longicatena sp.]